MVQENFNMAVTATGSDDGSQTYEIRRTMQREGRKSLVIELYPTLACEEADRLDLSSMHLMNHASELGWNDVRVVNLYADVVSGKPRVSELNDAENSLPYIEDILEEDDINEYDIIIAWGSALSTHKASINLKIDILTMLKEKGLTSQIKCIGTDTMFMAESYGVHPLYLGLHYGKDVWSLVDYPLEDEIKKLNDSLRTVQADSEPKGKRGRKKNVSEIKECA